ncbi:TerB family tellurite resistance protein [Flavobacteriaceae bacterium]|jgi:DnaJ like chaperone protein|nr:TerB family tellurite resistance protein [Flavobacteriaceae bacterium]MDB2418118.1 TerB family tellurite resistance protein [Flavobacteriaceae bacterium]MDB2624882.1 TerB family tellurite resistance protein [Flavobacteriaceae bacterium]MDB2658191.1 TerB family tellurite resistance protein [Flavobacteriaceae bacterium]MDG1161144.1 TerB family tellurite resistance protein [Flavobacteriaceae bacterium]|tara:strand:- start:8170 stop:8925 length:756 start_codon:yes stop_codon:yes gene_type:complete
MSNFSKWLGAGIGFTFGGPIGAILGFVAATVVDKFTNEDFVKEQQNYQKDFQQKRAQTLSGDFEISLLILASVVIKADGKVDERELNFVRSQFVGMYGKDRANKAFQLFKGMMKKQVSSRQVCIQIRQHMPHSSRLQLIHFLFGIAKADEYVSDIEVDEIRKIAGYLYVNQYDFESIKAMFYKSSDSAYKILEVETSVTDSELKTAYRKMVKKYHPDKLIGLGDEHLKGAKEKFQRIQEAYEAIKNERGIS